jgi:hypothetical protein
MLKFGVLDKRNVFVENFQKFVEICCLQCRKGEGTISFGLKKTLKKGMNYWLLFF